MHITYLYYILFTIIQWVFIFIRSSCLCDCIDSIDCLEHKGDMSSFWSFGRFDAKSLLLAKPFQLFYAVLVEKGRHTLVTCPVLSKTWQKVTAQR